MTGNVRSSVAVTLSVWKALFLRETVTRLSTGRAAWLWLLLEPVAHVIFMMALFSFVRDHVLPGVSFPLFLMTGVVGYQFFRNAASRSIDAISANAALFSYRQVKPVDAVLVRAVLEACLQFLVFVFLIAGACLLGLDAIPADPLGVIVAILLLAGFGMGLGLIFSVGADLVPEIGKVIKLALTPLYLLSGVMFLPALLPAEIREWFFLNPVAHGMEALREAYFESYPRAPELDLSYLLSCTMISIGLGLALHVRFAQRLLAR